MKVRKLVALVTAGMMVTSLTATAAMAESGAESVAEAAADGVVSAGAGAGKGHKIALIQAHQLNAFQIAITEAAEAAAEELELDELKILSADQDAATQIQQIEQCVDEGYEAIIFEPTDPDGLVDASKAAAEAGVVVVNIVSACTGWEEAGIAAASYGDNVKAGETEMQAVADLLGGKGNIAILTGPSGDAGGLQRMEGYEKVLANYPDMVQVVEPADCGWDTASAQATVESWLSAYDLDAIVCENDGMAVGAGNAAGADSGIVITGVDGTPDGFEAIQDGRISGTVSQNGGQMAANGINAAVILLNGGELPSNPIITTNSWIDGSNVGDFE